VRLKGEKLRVEWIPRPTGNVSARLVLPIALQHGSAGPITRQLGFRFDAPPQIRLPVFSEFFSSDTSTSTTATIQASYAIVPDFFNGLLATAWTPATGTQVAMSHHRYAASLSLKRSIVRNRTLQSFPGITLAIRRRRLADYLQNFQAPRQYGR
jgi:hypothetical protein